MAADLLMAPEAEQDLAEAYAWYETQRNGLGQEFLSWRRGVYRDYLPHTAHVPGCAQRIPTWLGAPVSLRSFYEQTGNTVIIYGVFHTSRDPDKWRLRLS
jgi:hypothetical protein